MTSPSEVFQGLLPKVTEHLEHAGYVLVDARSFRAQGGRLVLEILVDRAEGGISIDEVAVLSREVAGILDASEAFASPYVLDVSSPGLDRPLTTPADFKRTRGRDLRVFLREPVGGKIEYLGTLAEVQETGIVLINQGETITIPFASVNKAKQVIA